MSHRLSRRSRGKMRLLHPDMKKVVVRASEIMNPGSVDFRVGECDRSAERQQMLVKRGASKTFNSRHLVNDGVCHAVDLIALIDGKVSWDWPLYHQIADAMKQAARELNIPIEWGGDWQSFQDGPHFQLPWKDYPA